MEIITFVVGAITGAVGWHWGLKHQRYCTKCGNNLTRWKEEKFCMQCAHPTTKSNTYKFSKGQ